MKSKRSPLIVVTDRRSKVEHHHFEDGTALSIIHISEADALKLGRKLLNHIPKMRKKYGAKFRGGYFAHLNPEISFFIVKRTK